MYYQKMARHTRNDKLLIYCFQESLIGSSTRWYMKLDRNQICAWKVLVKLFLAQYDHAIDITLDHMSLMTMEK